MKILLVEDDELISTTLAKALTDQHYTVDVAGDGRAGWQLVESLKYDLVLLDVMLPKLDGISFCRKMRSQGNQTPILLLTAQDASTNRVIGLDAGADDYVAKPFDLQELLARIRALLRRGSTSLPPQLEWRLLKLDPSTCEVSWDGTPLRLTPKEYGLLELFLRNPHRIFSCGVLIEHLWSLEEPPTEDTVRSHLKGLRHKLKVATIADDPIETVYGIGYKLRAENGSKVVKEHDRRKSGKTAKPPNLETAKIELNKLEKQTNNAIDEVWQRVKDTIEQRVTIVEQATAMVIADKLNEEMRSQAESEAHKLVGSLGMFGSDEGSRIAKKIELLFRPGILPSASMTPHLSKFAIALRQEIQRMNGEDIPELLVPEIAPKTDAKIMVVDDDPNILTALQTLLVPWGLAVSTLNDPLQFSDNLASVAPDLLVLDVEMPHKSGLELCQLVRNDPNWSGLPILFLTGRTDGATKHKVFATGADDYVSKPIVEPELITRILNRIERSRLLRSLANTDALTGVANRRKSTEELVKLIGQCATNQQTLCFAIAVLDNLKQINRQYGHAIGDRVLSRLGELLRKTFRSEDTIGRWGGKEFVLGIAGLTKQEGETRLTEVLESFRKIEFTDDKNKPFKVTFSAAIAQYPEDGSDLQSLYHTADEALDRAKPAEAQVFYLKLNLD